MLIYKPEKMVGKLPEMEIVKPAEPRALRIKHLLNNAISLNDLRIPPANRLEKLTGDRSGQYSIRVNDQWRICFEWRENNAYLVELTDYH